MRAKYRVGGGGGAPNQNHIIIIIRNVPGPKYSTTHNPTKN